MASFQALFLRRRAETSASQDWRVGARIQLPTGEYGCFPSTAPTLVCEPPLRPSEAGQRDQATAELSCVASL